MSAEGWRRSEAVHPAGEEVVRAREGLPKMVASNFTSSRADDPFRRGTLRHTPAQIPSQSDPLTYEL